MKNFVIFLLTALLVFSGCAKEKRAGIRQIEEDILAERLGENSARQPSLFSITECEILKSEKQNDGEKFTVRAIAEDEKKTVKVIGLYVITYVNQLGKPVQESFLTENEKVIPQNASDFSEDELLLALMTLGLGNFSELSVIRHSPSLLNGTDSYLIAADGSQFEIEFTYSLKLGWSIKTASLT